MDLNASGPPRVISNGRVQSATLTGGLERASRAVPGLTSARSSNATSVNVGVGGSPAHFTANSHAQVDDPGHAPDENTTGTQMVALGLSGSLGRGDSHPQYDLIDVNGDGLPDIVTRNGNQLMVSLNLVYSFAPPEPWGTAALGDGSSENGSGGASRRINDGVYDYAGGASPSKDPAHTREDLVPTSCNGQPDPRAPPPVHTP